MISFQIIPNFFRNSYEPGKGGIIGASIINTGKNLFYLMRIGIRFDWQGETHGYSINSPKPIQPQRVSGLGNIFFRVPPDVTGLHTFNFFVDCIEFDPYLEIKSRKQIWTNYGQIVIHPNPIYTIFIGRSNKESDKVLINPIVDLIKAWSIQPITVGINVKGSKDPKILERIIVNEIKKSEGIICIATKRDRTEKGEWKTSAWVHTEAGISLYPDKPCLVLYDEDVTLDGAIWGKPKVPLNLLDYNEIEYRINFVMGKYRKRIQQRKDDELIKTIGKISVVASTVALGAYGIYSIGKEAGRRERDYYE